MGLESLAISLIGKGSLGCIDSLIFTEWDSEWKGKGYGLLKLTCTFTSQKIECQAMLMVASSHNQVQVQVQVQVPSIGTSTSINVQGLKLRDVGKDWDHGERMREN